jgi:hypothetical protein
MVHIDGVRVGTSHTSKVQLNRSVRKSFESLNTSNRRRLLASWWTIQVPGFNKLSARDIVARVSNDATTGQTSRTRPIESLGAQKRFHAVVPHGCSFISPNYLSKSYGASDNFSWQKLLTRIIGVKRLFYSSYCMGLEYFS